MVLFNTIFNFLLAFSGESGIIIIGKGVSIQFNSFLLKKVYFLGFIIVLKFEYADGQVAG